MQPQIFFARGETVNVLKFVGDIRFRQCVSLNHFLDDYFNEEDVKPMVINLLETTFLDSTALGGLAKVAIFSHESESLPDKPLLIVNNPDVQAILTSVCFNLVFEIVATNDSVAGESNDYEPLAAIEMDQLELTKQMFKAHQQLMRLSRENQVTFEDVANLFEEQGS